MAKKNKIMVIASGYFNPLHKGHVEYLNRSKALGDFLFVIVNNDDQRELKGSAKFMDEKERAHQIDVFQNTPEIKIFLLSLRAGNSGLNLTAADYVFLADPWWNPFTMKQAEDRAHRIGQNKTVMSYKFITKNTIEEKILALQMKKTKLAESIIPDEDAVLTNLDIEELEELLN